MCNATTKSSILSICIYVFTILMLSGCSIKGSFQGLYSYQDKTTKIAPYLIQKPTISVCNLTQPDTPVIYTINGNELKRCIEPLEKSLVYIWRPKCSSDICISPKIIQTFCQTNSIELFIVAEYYDYETMRLNHPIKRPIFGVDCKYYSSHLTKKYMSMFLTDLLGQKTVYNENYFFLFNDGCLVDMAANVEKLKI